MKSSRDAEFRLQLAEGFLREAEQDLELCRWRSCVDNAQMSVENSAKAVIAMRGPVPKVHQVRSALTKLLADPTLDDVTRDIEALMDASEKLGFEAHVRSDYGDEGDYRTPWELFDRTSSLEAVALARQAYERAAKVVTDWTRRKKN